MAGDIPKKGAGTGKVAGQVRLGVGGEDHVFGVITDAIKAA